MARLTDVLLKNGPCDPRRVDMTVTPDADAVFIRPEPFECHDVYAVVDKFVEDGAVLVATGEYLHTSGPRKQVDAYRKALLRLGTGRAFKVKREKVSVH